MFQSIALFLLLFHPPLSDQDDIRLMFHDGMFSEQGLERAISKASSSSTSLAIAYKGVSQTMLAEYAFLPTSKLSLFNKGKSKIEKAIAQDPNKVELRYIRLLVQLNAPSMLGYNDEISKDVSFFVQNILYDATNQEWRIIFIDNLLAAKHLTLLQRMKLNVLKEQIG